jgi:hypothetical protein
MRSNRSLTQCGSWRAHSIALASMRNIEATITTSAAATAAAADACGRA